MAVNFLVMAVVSFILSFFNIQPYLTRYGLNYTSLAVFCLIWGMVGSFISLLLSKPMAKWMMGVQVISPATPNPRLKALLDTVYALSKKAGLPAMPEVGIFESPEVNAFATGATKRGALVAVSSGLLQRLSDDETEAVIGHEITHISNGDMVTMTLLQGIVNAFVMFFARIFAFVISRALSKDRDDESPIGSPLMYQVTVFILEMVFLALGSLVVAAFSRFREFRADRGGAYLSSPEKMISALTALKRVQEIKDPVADQAAFQAFKISSSDGWIQLFASHPPLEKRIERLKSDFKLTSNI